MHLPGASHSIKGSDKAHEKDSGCLLKLVSKLPKCPCPAEAKNGFHVFKWEKNQKKNTILWLVKIMWNSNFSVRKRFYQTQPTHLVATSMATVMPKWQSWVAVTRPCSQQSLEYLLSSPLLNNLKHHSSGPPDLRAHWWWSCPTPGPSTPWGGSLSCHLQTCQHVTQ